MLTNSLGQVPRYAGFWIRFCAYFIDAAIFVPLYILYYISHKSIAIEILLVVSYWLYQTILESSVWQATIGKKILGLKVTDEAGNRIGLGRANARFWSKWLSAIMLNIGYIMIAFTKKKQGLHDKIARTLVLKTQN